MNSTAALRERLLQMEGEADAEIARLRARIVELEVSKKKTQIAIEVLDSVDRTASTDRVNHFAVSAAQSATLLTSKFEHATLDRALTGVVIRQLRQGKRMTKEQLLRSFMAQRFLVDEADITNALRRLVADQLVTEEGGAFFIAPKSEGPDASTSNPSVATEKSVQDDLPQA